MNEVAVEREQDAKAAPGTLAGPTASAVLPAATGAPESLSHPRNTPLANLMVSAGPAQALSGMRTPSERTTPTMTEPETTPETTEQRITAAREPVRREAMRLAPTAQCAAEWEAGQ